MKYTVEYYTDVDGDWRWTLRHKNGKVVADSAEGYTRKAECRRQFWRIASALGTLGQPNASVTERTL